MAIAALLSHLRVVGGMFLSPRSLRRAVNQVTSHVVKAMDLYSVSAEDLATTLCFFAFHEMGESPRNMQYPDVDRRVIGQLAQSLSQNAVSLAADSDARRIP